MRYAVIVILAFAAAAAAAVNVQVPVDDITVNLGALISLGYGYQFQDIRDHHVGSGGCSDYFYRLSVNGDIGDRIFYRGEYNGSYYGRDYLGVRVTDELNIEVGDDNAPFGVENQTLPEFYVPNDTTSVTAHIAPAGIGIRIDYDVTDSIIPFGIGLGIYPHAGGNLDAGAARAYVDVWPGAPELTIGGSYYTREEQREVIEGEYPHYDESYKYVFAPRVGGDLGFKTERVIFQAEYMQYYIEDEFIGLGYPREPIYKSTYERGYYGLCAYKHPLPWKYCQAFQPYGRYERYEPPVLERGDIAEDRITGGFGLYFLGNNLMLRADYTRVLEDVLPMKNDEIASYFQLYF